MRRLRFLLLALLVLVLLLIGALAFVLYAPLSGGTKFLKPSQLISASPLDAALAKLTAEPTVQTTDTPAIAALALRYQPTLVVSGLDRNWPTSLVRLLGERWHGQGSCIYIGGHCKVDDPSASALDGRGAWSDYLRYPAPVNSVADTFRSAAAALGVPPADVRGWPLTIAAVDPFKSAQVYFYYLAKPPRTAYRGVPHGLISLEYWFYYPLNYFPLARIPLKALSDRIGSTVGNTDYHQGDLEHVAVLLDPRTMRPVYLWMARHSNEGVAYRWHSPSVQWQGDHATIYAAFGSHASYADCGIQRRSRTYWFINDYVVCIPHETYAFTYNATPLVDLSKTGWGCWRGHLGLAGPRLHAGRVGFAPYETPGPVSPLNQQENFRIACRVQPGKSKPPTPL
jgi:hypothetical protein